MSGSSWIEATRASYDRVAEDYAALLAGVLDDDPLDRALLTAFAEGTTDAGPVLDLGCGPGWITRFLSKIRRDVFGIDLSPQMVATARRLHPDLRFEVGSMTDLDLVDGSLGGVLAWYSLIHVPTPELPAVLTAIASSLAPGAPFMTCFQVGDSSRRLTQGYGHEIDLINHRRTAEEMVDLLGAAGLAVRVRVLSEPEGHERSQQCALMCFRLPRTSGGTPASTARARR